jgi:uncharacterized protein YaiI (UPF0178 family)
MLNGHHKLDETKQACVDLLTDALEEAIAGRISSVAIVVCMDDGIATVMAGKNGTALNIGCDDLKQKIHAAMFIDGNVAAPKRSAIVRAR